jgi:hypothetical protein
MMKLRCKQYFHNKILKIANIEKFEKDFVVIAGESYLRVTIGGHHTPYNSTLFLFPFPNKILPGVYVPESCGAEHKIVIPLHPNHR